MDLVLFFTEEGVAYAIHTFWKRQYWEEDG